MKIKMDFSLILLTVVVFFLAGFCFYQGWTIKVLKSDLDKYRNAKIDTTYRKNQRDSINANINNLNDRINFTNNYYEMQLEYIKNINDSSSIKYFWELVDGK